LRLGRSRVVLDAAADEVRKEEMMSEIRPEQSADAWTATQAGYDANIVPFMAPYVADMARRARLNGSLEVVEVAAGTGALTEVVAPRVKRVLATDFSPGMLEGLRARMTRSNIDNVTAEVMDGQKLRIEDASYDRALCNFGLMLFPDRVKGMSEMCRVLRPGGMALITGWQGPDKFPALAVFFDAVMKVIPDLPQPAGPPPLFSLADPGQFGDELMQAGFSELEVIEIAHAYGAESAESYWEMIKDAAPPSKFLLERVGPETAGRIRDQVVRSLRETFGDGPVELTNHANLGIGSR
jgi:SAM-dependent methyltransferase